MDMTDREEMTIGEIGRSVARMELAQTQLTQEVRTRHRELADKVNDALGPISVLTSKVAAMEPKVDRLMWIAAGVSALVSVVAWWIANRGHL